MGKFNRALGRKMMQILFLHSLPIAYKMAVSFSLVIILGMGLLGAVMIHYQEDLMRRQLNDYGITIVNQYAAGATDSVFTDDQLGMQVLTVNLVSDSGVEGAALFNEEGLPLVEQGLVPDVDEVIQQGQVIDKDYRLWEWLSRTEKRKQAVASYLAPVKFKEVTAGYALITVSQADIRHSFEQTLRTLLIATVTMMAIAIIIAYMMSRRLASPIKRIVAATDALGRGDYHVFIADKRCDELGRLYDAVNRMAQNMREKHQVEGVLTRLVSTDVAAEVLSDPGVVGIGSERVEASVLFVDIVGFTPLAEKLEPEVVVEFLNEYFGYFTQCSQLFFGAVDKFIGDCAMVIFGAPRPNPDHRFNAIACGMVITRLIDRLNRERQLQGKQCVQVRVGINSGLMMAGMIGARERMEYTVVGDAVNLASRIIDLADPGQIVVGEEVLRQPDLGDRVRAEPFRQVKVKGKSEMVTTYRIVEISAKYQRIMDNMIEDILINSGERKCVGLPESLLSPVSLSS